MHISDYLSKPLTPDEQYFKQLHDNRPGVYRDPLYNLFGHYFTSSIESTSDYLNGNLEQTNRLFARPLSESSLDNMNPLKSCSVFFSAHKRYIPSRFHAHEYFEIIYQYSGTSNHNINGLELKSNPGDMIFLPPRTFHSIISPSDNSITVNIGLKLSDFESNYGSFLQQNCVLTTFFKTCLKPQKTYDFILIKTPPQSIIGDVILNALLMQDNSTKISADTEYSYNTFIQASAYQLFALLFTFYGNSAKVFPYTNRNTATLVKIMDYLKVTYRDTDLKRLSSHFHFTEPYLSRMIKSGTGKTFSELLSSVRLNTSLLLLENTRLPVADIANMVGYKAPENYMRNFKSVYGVTPTSYRKTKTNLKRTVSP